MGWWTRWRADVQRRRAAHAALDELFRDEADLLARGRLAPRHRGRVNILEIEADSSGAITAILFGIVRHPKTHPLAPRGEEVLELLLYRPGDRSLEVVGGKNLTRTRGA